jgi:diaminohydroxyphosphoribosylaminopyrimidine deaminase/5-amino-6-(5-phosphoribosylamino)uracil reductase
MRAALAVAPRGWGRVAPNPLVGAVIVREGEIVARGWHGEFGGAHAEVEAIRAAGELARGATLYVTLEPCAHHGKTPPCTDAISEAGVRRVVFASHDPTVAAHGGAITLRERGIEVIGGVADQEARSLNRPFFHAADPLKRHRPWTELKFAVSLDGKVADAAGTSKWITGPEAREEVHRLRAAADAVAIGVGTAIADDPSLTVRSETTPRIPPRRVIFDRTLRLPSGGKLAQSARDVPVYVLCAPEPPVEARKRLEAAGVEVVETDDLVSGLRWLREAGIRSLLCEGGATLGASLLDEDLIDRLTLILAPTLLGPGGKAAFGGLRDISLSSAHRWRHLRSADTLVSVER